MTQSKNIHDHQCNYENFVYIYIKVYHIHDPHEKIGNIEKYNVWQKLQLN